MLGRIRHRLTFANVCSFLALTIALGTGGAYAANTIGSDDIIDESIQAVDLKNLEVKNADLALGAVNSSRIANGSIANIDLAADSVDGSKILNGGIANADLATDSVLMPQLADTAVT